MKRMMLLFLVTGVVSLADPAFLGYLTTKEQGTQLLVSTSAESAPRWTKVGDTVDGYKVIQFQAKDEVLKNEKDGRVFLLRLKESKVQKGVSFPEEASIRKVAEQIVLRMEKWDSDVSYQIAKADDGYWHVFATKLVDGRKLVRLIRVNSEGKATNFSKLTVSER